MHSGFGPGLRQDKYNVDVNHVIEKVANNIASIFLLTLMLWPLGTATSAKIHIIVFFNHFTPVTPQGGADRYISYGLGLGLGLVPSMVRNTIM